MDKQLLSASGFDLSWLQSMEAKHGPDIFEVISSFLNQGFSVAWVVSAIDKLHPLMMDILYKVFDIPAAAFGKLGASAGAAGSIDGEVSKETFIFLVEKALLLLPMLGLSGYKLFLVENGLKVLLAFLKSK